MNDSISVNLSGDLQTNAIFTQLAAIAPEACKRAVDRFGILIESRAKQNFQAGTIVNNGPMMQAIHYDGFDMNKMIGTVGVHAEAAPYVEFGTAPHMPPVDALIGWVTRAFGVGGGDDTEDEEAAWAMAMTIKEYGTQPHPFFFPAVEEEKPQYVECLKEELLNAFKGAK